jgi:hypothetical protein
MNPNCIERRDSTVVLQALHLMNNGMVHELADVFARRVEADAGIDSARQVDRIYLVALGRKAGADEQGLGVSSLARLTDRWATPAGNGTEPDRAAAAHKALATYCHAILNLAEFLYVD